MPKKIKHTPSDESYFTDDDYWELKIKDDNGIVYASSKERAEYFCKILNGETCLET